MPDDEYKLKLLRRDGIMRGGFINLMNLKVSPKDWPEVSRGLEALKRNNPDFNYEATFLDHIAVGEPPERK